MGSANLELNKKCFNIPDEIIKPTYYNLDEDYRQYEDVLNK